jgi:hypothetical protein
VLGATPRAARDGVRLPEERGLGAGRARLKAGRAMIKQILEQLVADANLVANVGVRLGRLQGTGLLVALGAANQALVSDSVSPDIVAQLQAALNAAVKDIAPISLYELRSGWTPYDARRHRSIGNWFFGIFAMLLIVATAYTTQVYDRSRALYDTTIELQDARGAEKATKLFGLLKRNQQDVIEAIKSGKKDFLYESFSSALYDLQVMNLRFQTYAPVASDVLFDLDLGARLKDVFARNPDSANPSKDPRIATYLQNYDKAPPADAVASYAVPASLAAGDLASMDVASLLALYITDLKQFNSTINVGFDPLSPNDYSYNIVRLRNGMRFLGSWLLPALYGMLGAVIFHMRRLLDPSLPNPSVPRFIYRIVLGGFAGIILVWFWTPSAPAHSAAEFAPLTAFGLAFLFGFSTDVFFQALDRMVSNLSVAIAK